ncbi:ATP-grasp domain-containing protein [Egbenema bharatensis]|uniref:ATP-grasp domain-containing protein n=1 Tax=Egbenema bharatensis TaxID=3463334 RepID=UPI003A88E14B
MLPPKIYNHDIMHCTHQNVTGNYLYGSRILGLTHPEDIVQLRPEVQPDWGAITAHYDRIGLSYSCNVIWDVDLKRFTEYPDYQPSVFIFGDPLHPGSLDEAYFREMDADWLTSVEFINNKNNFVQMADELGVEIPETWCFERKAAIESLAAFPYPCYIKPSVSVDGVGIFRCQDEPDLRQVLAGWDDLIPLQIQAEVVACAFLNLQYHVSVQGAERLAATEQVLDGYAHSGNRYPTLHQPWDIVEPMAEWLVAQGMKDLFAFDVAVIQTPTGYRYLAIECNPRFNGASYPTGIANKLKIPCWSSETFTTAFRSLKDLDLQDIEFDPHSHTGVILVNWGTIQVGKLGVLLAGSIAQQNQLRATLKQRLSESPAGCQDRKPVPSEIRSAEL